ncbi:MAG: MTAP family purine nucleoside phosphorylase, partial [Nitrospirae bacterium]|nr:MTAP family purine nucleoside phosphorylase [Nitrospirota bacterium]
AILDQIIDMTHGRPSTFYEEGEVYHVDFTEPFCPQLRACLIAASETLDHTIYDDGVYVCTNGPRLETKREISTYSCFGADVVGMTAMPEAILARELQICYSTVAVVTNYAAGVTSQKLTVTEVKDTMAKALDMLRRLLATAIATVALYRDCPCKDALKDAMAY